MAGVVPSTLYQKIKFMTKEQLVSVAVEEYMIATTSSGAPYVVADEKVLECSFRSLKFVNVMYVGEGSKIPVSKLSKTTHMTLKQVVGK